MHTTSDVTPANPGNPPLPRIPDYRRSVAAILPAVFGDTDGSWLPPAIQGARAVVLLVIDGLGWRVFDDAPEALVNLAALDGGPISTVIPATTSAALTSITTACTPAEHGITGFRVALDDTVLNVLRWQSETRAVRAPDPATLQPNEPFFGRRVRVVAKAEHAGSGFTAAHLRGGTFSGWRSPSTLVEHCRRAVADGAPFVYAYYPSVDEVAHEFGLRDGAYTAELTFADDLVGRLRRALPHDAALVVTADHGQVDVVPDAWIELAPDIARLVAVQAGDARFRHLYARAGAARELAAACAERFSTVAWTPTRRQLLDEGWLGPVAARLTPARIGDVVLAPHQPVGFVDPALPRERNLRSAHGAPTAEEMLVPLLAGRGGA
jgi:hypothetical protein